MHHRDLLPHSRSEISSPWLHSCMHYRDLLPHFQSEISSPWLPSCMRPGCAVSRGSRSRSTSPSHSPTCPTRASLWPTPATVRPPAAGAASSAPATARVRETRPWRHRPRALALAAARHQAPVPPTVGAIPAQARRPCMASTRAAPARTRPRPQPWWRRTAPPAPGASGRDTAPTRRLRRGTRPSRWGRRGPWPQRRRARPLAPASAGMTPRPQRRARPSRPLRGCHDPVRTRRTTARGHRHGGRPPVCATAAASACGDGAPFALGQH
jgi:hypothetical protein